MSEVKICDNCGSNENDISLDECPFCNDGESDYCEDCIDAHLIDDHAEDLRDFYIENKEKIETLQIEIISLKEKLSKFTKLKVNNKQKQK